jgi:hypothetical protein
MLPKQHQASTPIYYNPKKAPASIQIPQQCILIHPNNNITHPYLLNNKKDAQIFIARLSLFI